MYIGYQVRVFSYYFEVCVLKSVLEMMCNDKVSAWFGVLWP